MLSRFALLIGAPGRPGTPSFLPGVQQDLDNYYRFLRSPSGGAWREDEIAWLVNPSKAQLAAIARQVRVDYLLFFFSGHGATHAASQQQILQINLRERIFLREAVPPARWSLVLVDACRTYVDDASLSGFLGEAHRAFKSRLEPATARELLADAVAQCEPGVVVCYGCQKGAQSLDTAGGGYFATALLDLANRWVESPGLTTQLPIQNILEETSRWMGRQAQVVQQPRIRSSVPHRRNWFPFVFRQPNYFL